MNSMLLPTVADSNRIRTCGRQQAQGEFPDDAAFRIVEAVELVHHDRRDLREIEGGGVQQPIEQDFRHDHQDPRVGIDPAIAGHQADVVGAKSPSTARSCSS